VWWYKSVKDVILMDEHYGIKTPQKYLDICKEKGYDAPIQLNLNMV